MDPALLASFAAFGETMNFTRAAKKVGLSQPALFERIQKLGAQLEVTLYERWGRELVLTADGERVLAFARDLQGRLRSFTEGLANRTPRETVTLAAGEGSYLYLLGPGIATFVRSSRARLDLLTLGAKRTVEALRCGEADLGVAVLDLVPRGIDADDLVRTPLCLALPESHPLAKKRTVTLRDLRGERLVLTPEGQTHRDLVARALARFGEGVDSPIEADGWPLMISFVAMGVGVAIVNGICALPKGVVRRPLAELGTVTYRLLRRHGARLSDDACSLADTLKASLVAGAAANVHKPLRARRA